MKSKNILNVTAVVFALTLAGCSSRNAEEPVLKEAKGTIELNDDQKELADVQTGSLEYKLISSVISCTGEIEVPPQGMASVTAPLGGYIVETSMVVGTYVKKGQLLARLSNPEYIVLQQSYLETTSELKFAEQDYARQKLLQQQNATAEKKLQESESAFTVLKARHAGLKAQLKMIGIDFGNLEGGSIQSVVLLKAPIEGYVTNVNHHPGQFVEPREVIFEIVNLRDLHLHLNVFEQDITRIQKNQIIRFRPTGGSADSFLGKVSLISPQRNEEGRTYDIHAHIETGEDKLKPGMFVEAKILVSADSVPALPENALVYNEDKPYVLTEAQGHYSLQAVTIGERMDGWVAIKNYPVLEKKKIVIQGASRLFTAMRRSK